jgi:hypothetical protein
MIITVHTQLRLARDLTTDLRRPWERTSTTPGRLTPARVRRGFRHRRAKMPLPAGRHHAGVAGRVIRVRIRRVLSQVPRQ